MFILYIYINEDLDDAEPLDDVQGGVVVRGSADDAERVASRHLVCRTLRMAT